MICSLGRMALVYTFDGTLFFIFYWIVSGFRGTPSLYAGVFVTSISLCLFLGYYAKLKDTPSVCRSGTTYTTEEDVKVSQFIWTYQVVNGLLLPNNTWVREASD